jgi:hypothetical protein
MTEQMMRELVEEDGLTEEVARLRLQDADLWVLPPYARFDEDLQGAEGVRAWEEAAGVARSIADAISNGPGTIQAGPAITQLVWDAAARAEEALHRARRRAGNPELRSTVFGEVLAGLLEKRGLPVNPFDVGKLAEDAGLDGWKVINRMASTAAEDPGHLDGLADVLDLSEPEKVELALAYVFERCGMPAAQPEKAGRSCA